MASYQSSLSIDFGEIGYGDRKHAFRVRIDSAPLAELIEAARRAHRVYELMLIDRPGDIWQYVWVLPEQVPPGIAARVTQAREQCQAPSARQPHPWPEGKIPFTDFDSFFRWEWDDTEPDDEAWLNQRDTAPMRSFAEQALITVRAAQQRLDWNDPLLRHVVARMRSRTHSFCYLDRRVAMEKARELGPNAPRHTRGFYRTLRELLRDEGLASVAYRADGDYRVLRMMATEQRRRATLTGHDAGHALHLSALVNQTTSNEAWDSEIWFFDEGLAHGDLHIEGGGLGGNVMEVIGTGYRRPGRYILSTRDEGSIPGFDAEAGDGWVLYRKQQPDDRRIALERIDHRRHGAHGPILAFANRGATLFQHEKACFLIGAAVSEAARKESAATIAEWQRNGGDPLSIVFGETTELDRAGCDRVLAVPPERTDEVELARWLAATIRRQLPWFDVLVALDAPDWAMSALADRAQDPNRPWPAWIVATSHPPQCDLKPDFLLDGDLPTILADARRRAQIERPITL